MSGPFGSTPHNLFNTTSTSFYNGVIDQSLRFDNARNTYLNKTYGTAQTNTKKITASFWFKPSKISTDRMSLLYARNGGAGEIKLNNHKIYANLFDTGYDGFFNNSLIRDPAAWYHLVYQGDSTLSTASARNKVYLNGVQLENNASSYTQLNTDTNFLKNGQVAHIGRDADNTGRDIDGYMAELHVIDGSVVDHTEFGEFNEGIWIAKSYSGSYGNNGFHMTFADSTTIGRDKSGSGTFVTANSFSTFGGGDTNFTAAEYAEGFDGKLSTTCDRTGSGGIIEFTPSSAVTPTSHIMINAASAAYTAASRPNSVLLQGSNNDGASWTTIDDLTNGSGANTVTTSSFSNTTSYAKLRLNISENHGGSNTRFAQYLVFASENNGDGENVFFIEGLVAGDVVSDCPEHNFPVMNSICDAGSAQSIFAFTEGNLKIRNTASNYSQAITTQSVRTGKWYYECYINEAGYPSWMIGWMVGRQNGLGENEFPTFAGAQNAEQASFTGFGYFTGSNVYISDWGDTSGGIATQQFAWSGMHSAGDAPTTGDIIGVAADFDNRKFYWHVNGEYIDSGSGTSNPSTGANANSTYTASEAPDDAEKYPWVTGYGTSSFIMNFGQDGTFAGNKTAQGNADENGIGNFFYSVPTGFLAFAPQNFSDTTLSPNGTEQATDHYQTALYEGTGSSQNVTGVGFQPDWVWVKRRDGTQESSVTDSVRGVNAQLRPAATAVESSQTDCLTSFDSDGFTLGADASGNNSYNYYTDSHVAWCWKAGGAPTATNSAGAGNVPTTGSVMIDGVASTSSLAGTIAATKISANTKAGFSIVTYTGTGSNATVAHGLTSAPDVLVVKERSPGTGNWFVYSRAENDQASDEAHVGYFNLSTAAFAASASIFNDTPPTDTVFSVGTGNTNKSSDEMIAYLFHEVEGFSKFGYFAGNSSSDGTFVYCGFKPARIWLRQDATGIDWTSYDLKRLGFNVDNNSLRDKTAGQEQTDDDLDILSNGFKCRRNFANNQGDVLFFAWADSPFKYSNAR